MTSQYESVRNYIVAAIADAWAGVKIYVDRFDAESEADETVFVRFQGAQMVEGGGTPKADQFRLRFEIAGRFAYSGSDPADIQRVTKIARLKAYLLLDNHAGGNGFLAEVTSLGEPGDDDLNAASYVARLIYEVSIESDRYEVLP